MRDGRADGSWLPKFNRLVVKNLTITEITPFGRATSSITYFSRLLVRINSLCVSTPYAPQGLHPGLRAAMRASWSKRLRGLSNAGTVQVPYRVEPVFGRTRSSYCCLFSRSTLPSFLRRIRPRIPQSRKPPVRGASDTLLGVIGNWTLTTQEENRHKWFITFGINVTRCVPEHDVMKNEIRRYWKLDPHPS